MAKKSELAELQQPALELQERLMTIATACDEVLNSSLEDGEKLARAQEFRDHLRSLELETHEVKRKASEKFYANSSQRNARSRALGGLLGGTGADSLLAAGRQLSATKESDRRNEALAPFDELLERERKVGEIYDASIRELRQRRLLSGSTTTSAAPPPPPPPMPAEWKADPSGRHEHRYWDGARWTEHVANGGVQTLDPWE